MRLHRKIKRIDAAIIVLSTVLTVIIDLFVGAAVGIFVLSTFYFICFCSIFTEQLNVNNRCCIGDVCILLGIVKEIDS